MISSIAILYPRCCSFRGLCRICGQPGWGRVVTIGSVQEAKPHPDMLVYSASKAAQTNLMRSLALQLAKDGITVNNVARA